MVRSTPLGVLGRQSCSCCTCSRERIFGSGFVFGEKTGEIGLVGKAPSGSRYDCTGLGVALGKREECATVDLLAG